MSRDATGIGAPLPRVDGPLKVTGGARYAAEFLPPGLVHAVLVESAIAAGRIVDIETVEVEAAPGVMTVLAHRKALALKLDVGVSDSFPAFVDQARVALAELGADHFEFLVNNAGISHHAPITEVEEADLDALYRVHVKGVFFLTQALLPLMADGGRIVNVSSGLTRVIYPGSAAYAMMKGAVEILSRYLARELGERRIAANTVAPGAIQTDFSGGLVRDNPEVNRQIGALTALGRPGLPDDIGPMIASLLSEDNRWVNAQRIEVSGGLMI